MPCLSISSIKATPFLLNLIFISPSSIEIIFPEKSGEKVITAPTLSLPLPMAEYESREICLSRRISVLPPVSLVPNRRAGKTLVSLRTRTILLSRISIRSEKIRWVICLV